MVQRLAHAQVLERVFGLHAAVQQLVALLVHADEDDAVLRPFNDLHAGGVAQPWHVARRGVEHEVELARHQRGQARGVVGNRAEDNALHIAAALARGFTPPRGMAFEAGARIGLAARQHKRARAVGVEGRVTLLVLLQIDRALHLVLFAPGLVHDEDGIQVLQEHRVDTRQVKFHRVGVDRHRRAQRQRVDVEVGRRQLRALHRKHHVFHRQRAAVVEFHTRAQRQAPDQRAGLLPAGGQRGHDGQQPVAFDQAFIDHAVQVVRHTLVLGVRVHRQAVALAGPAQGLGRRWRRGQQGQQCKGSEPRCLHLGSWQTTSRIARIIVSLGSLTGLSAPTAAHQTLRSRARPV